MDDAGEAAFVDKVCPVVLRRRRQPGGAQQWQVLVFRHPIAGIQLVKGTLEAGEEPAAAALRELAEESGITRAQIVVPIGGLTFAAQRQRWHLFLCRPEGALPEQWTHWTADGGGHLFQFFWHPLAAAPTVEWYPAFQTALAYIREWQERGRH